MKAFENKRTAKATILHKRNRGTEGFFRDDGSLTVLKVQWGRAIFQELPLVFNGAKFTPLVRLKRSKKKKKSP